MAAAGQGRPGWLAGTEARFRHGLGGLAEALFPPRCFGCGRRGTPLCAACRAELPLLPGGLCPRCAGLRGTARACRGCLRLSPALAAVRAVFVYEGSLRSAIHVLKFRSGRCLAPVLGQLMREQLRRRPLRGDLLVPVPLAPGRRRQRGYNQAALLAEQLVGTVADALGPDVLRRQDRPAQQRLAAAERWENLRGAISCAEPGQVRGRHVVVTDDVMTTGATLSACAEALAAAGARRVSGLVLARDL